MRAYIDRDKLEDFAMNCVGGMVTMKQIHDFPAIHVPPHGRLIDADALLNRDADYEYPLFDTDGSWDCVVPCYDRETIKSAPTVIEAEEVEP
jgi:hypothetical protein